MDVLISKYIDHSALIPYKIWDVIEQFYTLIEWINNLDALSESNDCTFNVLENNSDKQYAYAKKCSARLMILFQNIPENCQEKSINWVNGSMIKFNHSKQT